MYQIRLLITVLITIGVECATIYPRSYDSTGYSSTISNLNDNYPYGKVGYSSAATFPEGTRHPNYSPSYGYSTPGYTGYSSTKYPGYNTNGYSTNNYNSLYSGGSNGLNNGYNSYGSVYGKSGSSYGTGLGSTYGTGLGSSYGNGLGSTYETGLGSSYGTGLGSSYGTGAGPSSGTGAGSSYGTGAGSSYGTGYGSTYGTGLGSNYGTGLGSSYGSGSSNGLGTGSTYGTTYGSGSRSTYGTGYASDYSNYGSGNTLYSSYEMPFMRNQGQCLNRGAQNGIYVDRLKGMWYGVEYIQHLGVDSQFERYDRDYYYRSCIVIHISEPMDRCHVKVHLSSLKTAIIWTMLRLIWLTLIIFTAAEVEVNKTDDNATVTCEREHKYDDLDIRTVFGKWKVVEVYMHLSQHSPTNYDTCPIVTIWETDDFPRTTYGPSTEHQPYHQQAINAKFRQQYRHLRLLWDEGGYTTEYALYFRNDSAGYWQAFGSQNGTMASRANYKHFSGTVQVLKAVNDHLVLNFCQEDREMGTTAQLFSVLFSRNPGEMSRWEVDAVHSMLQNKKLSTASRRMVCGNSSADRAVYSIVFSILTCILALIVRSS